MALSQQQASRPLASALRALRFPVSILPAFVVALLASCGPPPEPCVECPDVSGLYVETIPYVSPEKSTCNYLAIIPGSYPIEVYQSGADFEVYPLGLTGVIYDDLSVRFATMSVSTTNVGEVEWKASGRFMENEDGTYRFRGRYRLTRLADKCRISTNISWDLAEEEAHGE